MFFGGGVDDFYSESSQSHFVVVTCAVDLHRDGKHTDCRNSIPGWRIALCVYPQ